MRRSSGHKGRDDRAAEDLKRIFPGMHASVAKKEGKNGLDFRRITSKGKLVV